jgi:hypothetical protein
MSLDSSEWTKVAAESRAPSKSRFESELKMKGDALDDGLLSC